MTSLSGEPDGDADDRALIQAHVAGDTEAFGALVRRHQQRMWAVAVRTLRDPDEAADAVQDAFVSAYRAAGTYRGDSRVTTWLHRIVVNACLDRARRRAARPTVPLPATPPPDPRDWLGDRETGMDIERALARLPEEQRLAIVLLELQGLTVHEVAEVLGVPEGTVKSRCHRARARLAIELGHLRNPAAHEPVPPVAPTPEGGLS